MESTECIRDLRVAIEKTLFLPGDTLKILCFGRPLTNAEATLESYGIKDGCKLTVLVTPNVDMDTPLSIAIADIFRSKCSSHDLPSIIQQFSYIFERKVNKLSLDDLEKYAKVKNSRFSEQSTAIQQQSNDLNLE